MSSQTDISDFSKIDAYYQQNKTKPWYEWLEVKEIFPRPGKQGLLGLMVAKDDPSIVYVFKISQYINYLVQHELTIMKSLNSISNYCPHFCKAVGGIFCEVDPISRKDGNPFEANSPYLVEKEVLLMEHLDKTHKYYNYIKHENSNEDAIFSILKQTMMAIAIGQNKKGLTHYDLHSNNVLIKRCSRDLVFLYILDEQTQFCIPTYGYYPVIIDYGFSYSNALKDSPFWPTMGHTHVGFTSDHMDPYADPKLFLVTVSGEIHEYKRSKRSKKLMNITKNMFSCLDIDWYNGWDNGDISVMDSILDLLPENYGSKLFEDYNHYCFDLIQSLIILPLQKQKYNDFQTAYRGFIEEFIKIENEVGSPFYCLYILKTVVDSARIVSTDYRKKETREHAINYFRVAIRERIDSVAKYCKLTNLHYEKMLCSLLCFARALEGIMYKKVKKITKNKTRQYKKLPLKSISDMIGVIQLNLGDNYVFTNNTKIIVVDCVNEQTYPHILNSNQIDRLNNLPPISWGVEMYNVL